MSRIVLLHLSDSHVDILSRVRAEDPAAELVVVHPRKEALIRRLARIAEVSTLDSPPSPSEDDLVIVPDALDQPMLDPWIKVGARIVSPDEYQGSLGSSQATEARRGSAETAMPESNGRASERPEPTEMLASPEASFAYLVVQTLGSDAGVTLWWDGQVGFWTPWAGELSVNASAQKPEGLSWTTNWGGFVLSGERVKRGDWNQAALKRISEDLALRDLMTFNQQMEEHVILENAPQEAGLGDWLEAAARLLKPQAAMAWVKDDTRWQLDGVFGNGIVFSGSLKLDNFLLSASFGSEQSWEQSSWGETRRIYWRFGEDNRRWPLYLKRLTAMESRGE